jgi:hypothetical protein
MGHDRGGNVRGVCQRDYEGSSGLIFVCSRARLESLYYEAIQQASLSFSSCSLPTPTISVLIH